jgi:glycosyltransferase involved in cell wall biosynthesis
MGWDCEAPEHWVLHPYECEGHRREFEDWWREADVVLCGEALMGMFAERLREGRLTFYMSERWWKPPIGMARLLHPRFAWMATRFFRMARSPHFHFLPAGRYAASDMKRLGVFPGRMWQWGYFTALLEPSSDVPPRREGFEVLWAGRMLGWKRVDTLIRAFCLLQKKDEHAKLTLIGDGPRRAELGRLARRLGILNKVTFRASMPAREVRDQMRRSHVFVLSSNGGEGWGAVVNEAMSEGCAVVGSEGAGAARTIIQHAENGFLFKPGDWRTLGELLFRLCEDEPLRLRLAEAGQRTIAEEWSPSVAAGRLLAVCEALLSGRSVPNYASGPMKRC